MQGERFIPVFLIMKKDLFVKQHFNGDDQKYPPFQPNTPFWTCFPPISIDKDGKFSCRLDVIKLHFMTNLSQFDVTFSKIHIYLISTVRNWSYLSTEKN